jgi:tellurite resistance protein TehA-like permease
MSDAPAASTRAGALATLSPAYFAMVMATGIVSIACHLLDMEPVALVLFGLNLLFYAVLLILAAARLLRHPRRVRDDMFDHARCAGFFTLVAGTGVLGSQALLVAGWQHAAVGLWALNIALWIILSYTIFTVLTVKASKPTLGEGINGGWLLAVVAAQSVAVLGTQLAQAFDWHGGPLIFFCLAVWLGGGMLYIWIISLIFYRYTFFALSPTELSPPYWINMGAVAISTLAGAMLASSAPRSSLLAELLPFIKGLTLLFWATATWWIPMLLILGVWRHAVRRFPLRYDPMYWGAVFPLGMYTTCTYRLAHVLDTPFLLPIPRVFIYIALAAWGAAAMGLAWTLARATMRRFGPGDARP